MSNRKGITPLMMCAIRNNLPAYELMFSNNIPNFEEKCIEGLRAIDYAVLYGHYEFAKKLLFLGNSELQKP